jgi:hypothetical protein
MLSDLIGVAALQYQGSLVNDLGRLARAGIPVISTAVLPVESFHKWQETGFIDNGDVDRILNWTRGVPETVSHLMIRTSVPCKYYGLLDKLSAACNFAEIRSAIDRIYRSWGDEKGRASRIVCKVKDADSKPSLVAQPLVGTIHSVLTRHAIEGTLTKRSDYKDNVNNRLPQFTEEVEQLIKNVDTLLGRPIRIDFTSDEDFRDLAVVSISDQPMTADGRWHALADLLDRQLIGPAQFLLGLTPDMIGFASGMEFDPTATSSHVKGLPASSGLAVGKLVFPDVNIRRKKDRGGLIFIGEEACPEDIDLLERCRGAIGLVGGMTGHLAMICRGMGKPAVTSCGGKLDFRKRTYTMPDGQVAREFTTAFVDGRSGDAAFSDSAQLKPHWVQGGHTRDLVSKIVMCCAQLPHSEFKQLSVESQWHIAELRARIREMGLSND